MTAQGRHVEDQAWVTLATNDTYGLGALVLAHSLIRVATSRKLVILVTPGVSNAMRTHLGQVFDHVSEVNVMDSSDAANLALLTRPDLGVTFTKLHCWRLTQFNKCVFMDADTMVMQNCDELFDSEEFSAAPDVGWPDCFNSGVFVYRPSNETYAALVQCALTTGSFDGGDQGLLNVYFRDWATKDIAKHLPFIYNMTSSAAYSYLPAYLHFGKDVKIVHFIGPVKPWNHHYNSATGKVDQHPGAFHSLDHLQVWWDIFAQDVHSNLQPELTVETKILEAVTEQAGLAAYLSQLSLGVAVTPEQKSQEDRARQFAWEQGHIDYMGADAFTNIQRKLDESIVEITTAEPQQQETPSGELESLQTESESQTITDGSIPSAEAVSVVSCPLAVPISPVHRSSIHLSEPIKIPGADTNAAEPASGIPASTRMDIIPAIPRTPPIVPSTPIMLPPPPAHSTPTSALPTPSTPPIPATPSTPVIIPATPGTPPVAPATPTDPPAIVPVIPCPEPSAPITPPASGSVAQSPTTPTCAVPTTAVAPKVPSHKKISTSPAIPETDPVAAATPPLPPRAPVPAPEAAAASLAGTPSKPSEKSNVQQSAAVVAEAAVGEVAPKQGGKKQAGSQQPKAAAAAPSAPVRKGDKGKPSKK